MRSTVKFEKPSIGIRRYTVCPVDEFGSAIFLSSAPVVILAAACLYSLPETSAMSLIVVTGLLAAMMMLQKSWSVIEESLLVMEGVGVQVSTRFARGSDNIQFIEIDLIAEIVLTEAVHADRCFYFIAILSGRHDRDRMPSLIVPFRHLLPRMRLEQLQQIYSGIQTELSMTMCDLP